MKLSNKWVSSVMAAALMATCGLTYAQSSTPMPEQRNYDSSGRPTMSGGYRNDSRASSRYLRQNVRWNPNLSNMPGAGKDDIGSGADIDWTTSNVNRSNYPANWFNSWGYNEVPARGAD